MEHGVLGGVAGGHIVPGIEPLGLVLAVGGLLAGVGQVVALGDDVAVVAVVVGHGGDAQGLAAGHQMLGQQVVLEVGLMGGIAGLALELLHPAVELGEADGVPLRDEPGHVLGLGLGLEGVVAVQVEAAGGGAGHIGPALHVLLGDDDEEHVVQERVDVHGLGLDGVVLLQVHGHGLAGGGAVGLLALDVAQIGGGIGHQVGDGQGALLAHRTHLLGQFGLALGGEAGEPVIVDGAGLGGGGLHQHPGEGEHAVGGGHLVGVDVGVHHRHLVVGEGAVLDLLDEAGGVGLGLLFDRLPLVQDGLVPGDDQIGHIQALHAVVALAGAHGVLAHIDVGVLLGIGHQLVDGVVDLLHGVEVVIGGHLDGHLAQLLPVQRGAQVIPAAHIQISAAVGMGGTGVGGVAAGGPVVGVEVDAVVEGDVHIYLPVFLGGGGRHIGEQGGLAVGAQPVLQFAALAMVGEQLGIHIGLALVVVQGPDDGAGGLLGLLQSHVHRDAGREAPLGGEGDGVIPAVIRGVEKNGGRSRLLSFCGEGGQGAQADAHGQRDGEGQHLLGRAFMVSHYRVTYPF